MNHESAFTCLQNLTTALSTRYKGKFFLADGTLLGFVREGDFIRGDTDIDIGMWADDYDEQIITDLESSGFILVKERVHRGEGQCLKFLYMEVLIDIFFFVREPEVYWMIACDNHRTFRYNYTPFVVKSAAFKGLDVNIPFPTERYLEQIYGQQWTSKSKEWSYKYATNNGFVVGNLLSRVSFRIMRLKWRLLHRNNYV